MIKAFEYMRFWWSNISLLVDWSMNRIRLMFSRWRDWKKTCSDEKIAGIGRWIFNKSRTKSQRKQDGTARCSKLSYHIKRWPDRKRQSSNILFNYTHLYHLSWRSADSELDKQNGAQHLYTYICAKPVDIYELKLFTSGDLTSFSAHRNARAGCNFRQRRDW